MIIMFCLLSPVRSLRICWQCTLVAFGKWTDKKMDELTGQRLGDKTREMFHPPTQLWYPPHKVRLASPSKGCERCVVVL